MVVYKDRVGQVTSTTGSGDYSLGSVVSGFQSFDSVGDGNQCHYTIRAGADWEVGLGTLTVGTPSTLSRDEILDSSTGVAIDWPAGAKSIYLTSPAQMVGATIIPRTAAEIAAGVTPTDYSQPPSWATRYGTNTTPGTTDMTAALQASIDANSGVYLPAGTYAHSDLDLPTNGWIRGEGQTLSIMSYTGSAKAVNNPTPTSRIYRWNVSGVRLIDAGTGTTGFDLSAVSLASFRDVEVIGFDVGVDIYSPTSGYAVYNRFWNVLSQCATGYKIQGLNSNANIFIACRTNLATTRAVDLQDSNNNHFAWCQFESGGDTVAVELSAPGGAGRVVNNSFTECRMEGYEGAASVGYKIGENCTHTRIVGPLFPGTDPTALIDDSGTRTIIPYSDSGRLGLKMVSALPSATGTPFLFERDSAGTTANVPALIVRDSNTGSGTPTTLRVETERNVSLSIEVMRGTAQQFAVGSDGKIRTNQAAANVATPSGATAYAMPIYNASGTLLGYIPVYAAQWV